MSAAKDSPGICFDFLRQQLVGGDSMFTTPFGERLMVYCDYTASGRCLLFVENYLESLQRIYANTHTEDDITGRSMTALLQQAEATIKSAVNAGDNGRIISVGTGASGAIDKLQQILGVTCPPATHEFLNHSLDNFFGEQRRKEFATFLDQQQAVIFTGPYEHHSNEISWRQGLATVVTVDLATDGSIDLAHLEQLLQLPEYQGRLRIGSFSAASNVTGMRSAIHEIARLLHHHDAIVCFDYAASAPYVEIDMNPPQTDAGDASIDAIFISPHKFIGGPGSSGILVFNRRIYNEMLPPTVAAGGTVDYVSPADHDFIRDIEEREKAGTPGVLQTLKAAMVFSIKDEIGSACIEEREHQLLSRAFERWKHKPQIEIMGNPDPTRRIGIVSFNIRESRGRYLHPKFLTALLNDLFGIQSRAGCSCAGPYGHRLLGIDQELSERYRHKIANGYVGLKPGWCRVGFHYTMDDAEADYVIDAIEFIASYGHCFLPQYHFDLQSGSWTHEQCSPLEETLTISAAIEACGCKPTTRPAKERQALYVRYLREAQEWADQLSDTKPAEDIELEGELGELQFFTIKQPDPQLSAGMASGEPVSDID
ncbi:MAG: aminotransferase class V-fold PLP-dependent enzyme [Gammaproteobacteria bacterium]|jgi:selenocysteine lyase/cysteine desulfurase|nr:aminotransferase [Chromatiales bacterium]MCP4926256.1 aminotransferase class V-fold PLP-dependent enzyme [Gammaproteobacteria bacterium]MDP7153917.1 aminotransferase class V-fold PLP-dependent enzyme [Gammaproteobacteria bacterium]MDP7296859.1 aminotransferase class V-fold PLP-dependent enzyme [Gammaproteobacteria bacterium]MDP7419324.1 aminotransferase class V-fold PLP-dependent enzyme [Gammaproteobacteria bacterium]